MKTEILIQNPDEEIYDISNIVTKVSWNETLNDGCSKLEISYLRNDKVTLKNGCIVRFKYNGKKIFFGKVFKWEKTSDKELSATCYDQLRYCKAKDTIIIKDKNLESLVKQMCKKLKLKCGHLDKTEYSLPKSIQDDKTWLDIVYDLCVDVLLAKKKKYRLADEFGSITLRDLDTLKTDLILGDNSLVYDYSFERSIDDDTYNYIKVVSDNNNTGKRDVYVAHDTKSISRYGKLMYFDKLDSDVPPAQAKQRADLLLKLYNRETTTLKLDCLGDTRIRAGVSFYCSIADLKIAYRVICKSVEHEYIPNHTMSLEVEMV